uniref:Uncharacterized protein n=1 Tax=Esox lucius TaxID=8010 RepID=A0A3P8YVI8_ESOLU
MVSLFLPPYSPFLNPIEKRKRCMQDFMDGYFPSELQQMFPEGVPFKVCVPFPGKGQAVFGAPGSERFTDSLGQFLNRLPKVVVKAGRVIDIRDSVKASLQVNRPRVCLVQYNQGLLLPVDGGSNCMVWLLGADAREYDILSAFPKRRYSEDSQTLLSCGLTPSTTLLLQPRPRPPVCQGVCS